ncbi:Alpha/Beta hydrolase protein [Schizothecium vesticola]|uniref:Alpha/Beta hydrolase protein n=1 Tax=Schizothecium vesticola TaxID=314040 RepID=A0AA40F1F0_9PEZI|nr:Alpha/Beta hydrolase protein [Schizothecium vesticola]
MSTMPATHSHSEACCNVPPVVSTGYTPKGSYDNIHDFKTYATGPDDATRGIVVVFDIFGYFDQTIQGADILANSDAHHKYKVVMPDWFKGDACPIEWYPPNTEQKQKDLGAWFGKHPPAEVVDVLPEYVTALNARYPSVKSWAVLGFCWGGKVVSLATSSALNPFKAAAVCHPAMVEPKDAAAIKVPFIMLASGEEPADKVKEFESKLEGPKHVEIFEDQVHGWMAARGDLSKERSKDEYVRGYKTVLEFFGKHWE